MSAIPKYDGTNSRRISGTALAVRTLSGQTKLLVPVSAAAATAKKPNSHHKQILVVPTPGGGARLATVANSSSTSSLLRHHHLNPHHYHHNSNNQSSTGSLIGVRRESPSSFAFNRGGGAGDGYKANSTSGSRYNGNHDNSNNTTIDTAQLLRQQQLQQQQLREQYLRIKKEEEMIPEWKRKEDFFAALGLVTKQALKEIQNKKCERKRRTTANPQFSNAAIEAKRINAMEVAAKRAKRKEMAAAAERNATSSTNAPPLTRISRRNQMPIVPIQSSSLRSLRPTPNITSQSMSTSSSSFHHRPVLRQFPPSPSTNMTVPPERSRNLVERLKSRYQLHNSPYLLHHTNSSSHNNNTSNNNATINSATNNSKSVNLINKPMVAVAKAPSHNCYACYESCDPDLDAIMFCKDCRCYFHATCVASAEEINKTNSVPCPSCDKETTITFDGVTLIPTFNDLDSCPNKESKTVVGGVKSKPNLEDMEEEDEDLDEEDDDELNSSKMDQDESDSEKIEKTVTNPKTLTIDTNDRKLLESNNRLTSSDTKSNRSKSNSIVSVNQKESLLNKKNLIAKLISEGKKRYTELEATLNNLKEDKLRLLEQRTKIEECLQKVTSVIKLVKQSEGDSENQTKPKNQINSIKESESKPSETIEKKITSAEGNKIGESDSSSSDDDSSDSDDSEDEDEDEPKPHPQQNEDKKDEKIGENESLKTSAEKVQTKEVKDENTKNCIIIVDQKNKEEEREIEKTSQVKSAEKAQETPGVVEESTIEATITVEKEEDTNCPVKTDLILDDLVTIGKPNVEENYQASEQELGQFVGSKEAIVIEEIVNLGEEVLITSTEDEGNLMIIGDETIALEKINQFDDETSAAVASIQDVMDVDTL